MVKANVKYDIKVHSAAVRSSPAYRIYRALAYAGAIEFILVSFIIVITAVSRHKVTLSLILLLSVFLGIFAGCAIKLLLMNPVRSFRSFSSYCPGLRYELTVDGDRIELFFKLFCLKILCRYRFKLWNVLFDFFCIIYSNHCTILLMFFPAFFISLVSFFICFAVIINARFKQLSYILPFLIFARVMVAFKSNRSISIVKYLRISIRMAVIKRAFSQRINITASTGRLAKISQAIFLHPAFKVEGSRLF